MATPFELQIRIRLEPGIFDANWTMIVSEIASSPLRQIVFRHREMYSWTDKELLVDNSAGGSDCATDQPTQ